MDGVALPQTELVHNLEILHCQGIDDSHCTDSSGAPFSGPGDFVHGHSSLGHFPFKLLQCALPGAALEYHLEAITCCQFPCGYNSKC